MEIDIKHSEVRVVTLTPITRNSTSGELELAGVRVTLAEQSPQDFMIDHLAPEKPTTSPISPDIYLRFCRDKDAIMVFVKQGDRPLVSVKIWYADQDIQATNEICQRHWEVVFRSGRSD